MSGRSSSGGRLTILLAGARGQLGRELAAALPACGDVIACDRSTLDLADPAMIRDVVRRCSPSIIVNAAAYTAVDRAETDRQAAFAINAQAPGVMAEEARRAGATLIHYSTDYVFDGRRSTPYDESSPTAPLNVYGASKLEGERSIEASGAAALVLRTSWVYSRHGRNFLLTIEKLAARRDEVRVVADQTGVPNWSRALASATARLVAAGAGYIADRAGLYHLSAEGSATWYDFARAIVGEGSRARIVPITTAEYPTPAARPSYGVLDASRFVRTFGFGIGHWQGLLHECMRARAEP